MGQGEGLSSFSLCFGPGTNWTPMLLKFKLKKLLGAPNMGLPCMSDLALRLYYVLPWDHPAELGFSVNSNSCKIITE